MDPHKIEHLRKEYPNTIPLQDVSVEINDGDVISVIGPSGTGKSTLLRRINRLEEPTSGKIRIEGDEITAPGYDITALWRYTMDSCKTSILPGAMFPAKRRDPGRIRAGATWRHCG